MNKKPLDKTELESLHAVMDGRHFVTLHWSGPDSAIVNFSNGSEDMEKLILRAAKKLEAGEKATPIPAGKHKPSFDDLI